MKTIITVILSLIFTISLFAQFESLQIERYNKKLDLVVANPSISVHFPEGLIYQDTTGNAFTNLSDRLLRIADRPIGFQSQPNNIIFSEMTKNSFSINHFAGSSEPIIIGPTQRAFWGPRSLGSPYRYDLNTFGNISTKNEINQLLTVITESSGRGAIRFYRYSGGLGYYTQLSIDAGGSPVWTAVSDRRVKENITVSPNILTRVLQLQLKNYNYKGNAINSRGFIAQEVQEVFPDLISEMDDGLIGVNYMGFGPLAIQAIKEQQEIIETLEERIERLEKLIIEK